MHIHFTDLHNLWFYPWKFYYLLFPCLFCLGLLSWCSEITHGLYSEVTPGRLVGNRGCLERKIPWATCEASNPATGLSIQLWHFDCFNLWHSNQLPSLIPSLLSFQLAGDQRGDYVFEINIMFIFRKSKIFEKFSVYIFQYCLFRSSTE